ncbi:putative DNA-binding transcriptional regulator YafY [Streptosporangium album]|uniref:Putative DNA-binding transcriptional regulator YafY n=1 Tax=Streptosporangium album TaxID=47479 RepID=A0A7W7RVX8_9ACTN|nr:putative DNA-binding transcriptional regulator YafY [Streptosporangium album]
MPPLLLDDEEAVAVAIGLRTANTVTGIEETSVRALAKLEQVLPARLRHRLNALHASTVQVPGDTGPRVDAAVLTALASTCRACERLRFDYRGHDGTTSVRMVEPHRLVNWGRRWYLVAFDIDRQDWRTFRADRITPRTPNGPRFVPRELPGGDAAAYVSKGVSSAAWRHRARVVVHAPVEAVADRVPPAVGVLEAVDEHSCLLDTGADTVETLALYLGALGADFTVDGPPELLTHLRELSERYLRATR